MAGCLGQACGRDGPPGAQTVASCLCGQHPSRRSLLAVPTGVQKPHTASPRGQEGDLGQGRCPPHSSPPAAWVQRPPGERAGGGGGRGAAGALELAYLTYCPFQIDFNEVLSVPHFLQLEQFPSGILLKLLFNLK